jgi:hypothetical protein
MEAKVSRNPESGKLTMVGDKAEYREAVRKQLNDEVKKIIDLEMQKAAQELIEEHKKATRQVVEEYRTAIHQIVQEEKEEIWRKAETLKKSILQLGL